MMTVNDYLMIGDDDGSVGISSTEKAIKLDRNLNQYE